MKTMKSIGPNKKGQFIIAAALLVALVILAVALQIYVSSNVHHEFRYKSYKEIVENADADFQNALTLALAKATHAYAGIPLWGPLDQTADTSSYEVLRNTALSSVNFWKLAATRSFSGTGFSTEYYFDRATLLQRKKVTPKYTIPNRWLYNLTKVYWFYPESVSAIGSDIAINVTGMGFRGFRSYHMASLFLIMDVEDLDEQFTEGNVNHLKVTVHREGEDPVYDLTDEDFLLVSFDLNTGTWRKVPLTRVKYMGEGNFTLSFPPSEVVAGPPPLASPPAPAAVPKYVNPQQAGATVTVTRTRTVTTTVNTRRTIPTTTRTRTRTTTRTTTRRSRTTTTRWRTTTTTRRTTVIRYVTSTRTRTRARDRTTATTTRNSESRTTRSITRTSTRTVVSSTVTETVTVPTSITTTTTTVSGSGTGTITTTSTTTTTVTAAPAPPRPLGGEVPPGTATVTVWVTTTRTVRRTTTTYRRTTTRWVDRTRTTTRTIYTRTYTRSSTRTRTRTSARTSTRRTTIRTTTTTYRNTVWRTVTTTRTTTVTDRDTTTTTRVLAGQTVTETFIGDASTATQTAFGVGGYTTTTTTTTMTIVEMPIRYSKWFQLLVRDKRGIIVEGMTYSHLDFEIRDWTRGPGSGVPPADLPPGFSFAKQITVENNLRGDDLESGYTVGFSLDTYSLVSSNKMEPDGRDLRIFYYSGGAWNPVQRHVLGMGTDSTEVRFKTQADIGPGGVDGNYFLCYGNPGAANPPPNLNDVYVFYDDFSIDSTGGYDVGRWLSLHGNRDPPPDGDGVVSPTWNSSEYWIDFDTGDNVVCGLRRTMTGRDLYAEMKVSWRDSYPTDTTVGIGMRWGDVNTYYVGHVSYGSYISPAIAEDDRESYLATPLGDTHFPKDGTWHKLAFAVWNDKMKLWLDDIEYLSAADSSIPGTPNTEVVFEFGQIEGSADDFMVREYVEPEPTVLVGFEVYPSGAGFSSSDSYETYNLEVMYNATSGTAWYWNGEQLEISGGYPPIPRIPIRQIRVNATAWGVGDDLNETPSQVEQWSSDLRTPLYVSSIGAISARFNSRSKLSFNVDFPWNVTVQRVRIWWVDDLEVAPPSYWINMTVAGPFVIVDNGRYELQLLAEEGYSTWIDWSVSLRYAGYHAEYALFGYDIYEIPPPGSGRYWIPMKIPAGSWDAPVMYGPVRAIAHRRSSTVYDYPNDVEINDELDHEMYVVVPYNTKYFFWNTNNTWLKAVSPRYLTFIAMISGDASDVGNSTLRVGKYAYQDPQGLIRTGSFPGGASVQLERLGKNFGYWAAQYRDGFGEAMFVNDRFLDVIKNDSRHPRPDVFIFTTADSWRRTVEYDAEDVDYGSIVPIQQGDNYLLSVAAWAYEGGWEEARLHHRMFVEEYYPTIFVLSD